MGRKRRKVWWVAPLCLFWKIWKERNSRAFEIKEHSIHRIKFNFLCNLWAWSNLFITLDPSSIVDFVGWIGSG